MTDFATIMNFIVAGVMTGGLYSLVAVGLTLVYSVMKIVNVAHGDVTTMGAYVLVIAAGASTSISIWLGIALLALALAVGAGFGVLVERFFVGPIFRSNIEVEQRVLVLTLGLSLFLANAFQAAFGSSPRQAPLILGGTTRVGDIYVSNQRLSLLVLSIVLVGALLVFLRKSRLGLAIRATSDNSTAAQSCGMNIRVVFATAFGLATALAAGVGVFVAPLTSVSPVIGFPFTIKAFIVVIVGGLGSMSGALVASYLLGITESLAVLWLPSSAANLIGPVLMLCILFARPHGVLGRRVGRT